MRILRILFYLAYKHSSSILKIIVPVIKLSVLSFFLESIYPFSTQKQIQENHRADAPGQRVCPEDHTNIRNVVHSNGNIADTEQTPDTEHDDHRNCCMTGAAKDCCDTVRKRQQKIEQRNRPRLHHTIMYHLRISVKCRDQRRSRHIDQNTDQFRNHYGAQDAKPRTFFSHGRTASHQDSG